jgi:methyl-accepting chemotaxis protein
MFSRLRDSSLKWKIFTSCTLMVAAVLLFNFYYVRHMAERASRGMGNELQGAFKRFQALQRSMGLGLAAADDAWTTSQQTRDVLSRGDEVAMKTLLGTIEETLKDNVRPDFIMLVDKKGTVVTTGGSPITAESARSLRAIADIRQGVDISNAYLEHKGRTYVVDGESCYRDHDLVGGMFIGMRLDRVMSEFKAQSDDNPKRQVELALIRSQEVTASSAKPETWSDLARAARSEARETFKEGGEVVSVLRLPDGRADFYNGQINGYDGSATGSLGSIYVIRNRVDKEAQLHAMIADSLVVLCVALALAACVSFGLSVLVTRPIKAFIKATGEIASGQGDLTQRIQVCSTATEMRELEANLNKVFDNIHTLASEVQGASFQVGASSAEISAASKQMLGGASDQAAKIESSTAAVTELSSSIQQVAENAVEATKVAKESGDKLQTSIGQLAATQGLIQETADKIQALGQSGKRIGNIVEVIRQISEQTSLLALNASIEAAHAGEQGRGFAVVADEVSSLARRVGQSAKDIEGLIAAITEQTAEAVHSMQNVTRAFGEQNSGAAAMQNALRQIVEVIQDTARSVQEQALVSDEIARNMDAVQKIAQEVLGSSEEAVVQGEQLHALALRLEQLVRGFQIEKGENGNGEAHRALPRTPSAALPEKSSERRKVARS